MSLVIPLGVMHTRRLCPRELWSGVRAHDEEHVPEIMMGG